MPVAGFAVEEGGELWLRGLVATVDGDRVLRAEGRTAADAGEALGTRLAGELLEAGAGEILEAVYGAS